MYNKYLDTNENAFSELYREVRAPAEREHTDALPKKENQGLDLKRLLRGIDIEKIGILPIVLLLLLLIDVDEEEKLIIIALAVIFGI